MLGGNQLKIDSNRLSWRNDSTRNIVENHSNQPKTSSKYGSNEVELKPMEIRTFVLRFNPK